MESLLSFDIENSTLLMWSLSDFERLEIFVLASADSKLIFDSSARASLVNLRT